MSTQKEYALRRKNEIPSAIRAAENRLRAYISQRAWREAVGEILDIAQLESEYMALERFAV